MHLSTSPGISLITWFLISASKTPTPVIKCDIKHTIVKQNKDNISLILHPVYPGKGHASTYHIYLFLP